MKTLIIIFGAGGDLTERKLIPSLYNLFRKKRFPEDISIIGFSVEQRTQEEFCNKLEIAAKKYLPKEFNQQSWDEFAKFIEYISGNFESNQDFQTLEKLLSEKYSPSNRIYYFAIAPEFIPTVASQLAKTKMFTESAESGYRRIVVEKPFGSDLASAKKLTHELHKSLSEHQIYRIDHYLGKETVQNILFFRFGNAIFEPLWNRNYIDHVQISVTEKIGVGHRAAYYEKAGALRDMFQNHLLQILALIAMEPPAILDANAFRNEKVKVLSCLRPIAEENNAELTVRGQYRGYTSEEKVAKDSSTETYAALKLYINNWRWQGVPFYLQSGKKLADKVSEIVIQFRPVPHQMFYPDSQNQLPVNLLSICIQPDEGCHLQITAKVPDKEKEVRAVSMDFHYKEAFGNTPLPEAYEQLLLNVMEGDETLFARNDGVDLAWKFIDRIRRGWDSETGAKLEIYDDFSEGPASAARLLERDKRSWIKTCKKYR